MMFFTLRNLFTKSSASSPENCRSINTTSGERNLYKFCAISSVWASATTFIACNRSAALSVANSNASSLATKTVGDFFTPKGNAD